MRSTISSPHSIEQGAIILDSQQLVGHCHVVGDRFLAIVEEGVWCPDLAGHEVVEAQDIHWPVELEPFISPALAEEDVYCVLLLGET